MRCDLVLLFVLTLCSCNERKDTRTPEERRRDQCESAAGFVTNVFCKKMLKEKGLVTIGVGGGGTGPEDQRKIGLLSVTFVCYQEMDINGARKLLLKCIDSYLDEINANQDLGECISPSPFTYKNVDVKIMFHKKGLSDLVPSPHVSVASLREGELKYKTMRQNQVESTTKETYEQALHILHSQSNSPQPRLGKF